MQGFYTLLPKCVLYAKCRTIWILQFLIHNSLINEQHAPAHVGCNTAWNCWRVVHLFIRLLSRKGSKSRCCGNSRVPVQILFFPDVPLFTSTCSHTNSHKIVFLVYYFYCYYCCYLSVSVTFLPFIIIIWKYMCSSKVTLTTTDFYIGWQEQSKRLEHFHNYTCSALHALPRLPCRCRLGKYLENGWKPLMSWSRWKDGPLCWFLFNAGSHSAFCL